MLRIIHHTNQLKHLNTVHSTYNDLNNKVKTNSFLGLKISEIEILMTIIKDKIQIDIITISKIKI